VEPSRRAPLSAFQQQKPVVDQHREELFDEERISFCRLDNVSSNVFVQTRASDQIVDHLLALLARERFEHDVSGVRPLRPGRPLFQQGRSGVAQDHDGRSLERIGQVLHEIQECVLGPVQVFEGHDQWPVLSQQREQLPYCPEELLHRELRLGEPYRRGDALDDVRVVRSQQPRELAPGGVGVVAVGDPGSLANDLDDRPERDPVSVGKTASVECEGGAPDAR